MPYSDARLFVSCAGDRTVRLNDITQADSDRCVKVRKMQGNTKSYKSQFLCMKQTGKRLVTFATTCRDFKCAFTFVSFQVYPCHNERVKSLDVNAAMPHMVWTASEDGTLREIDTRLSGEDCYINGNRHVDCPHILYDMRTCGDRNAELKTGEMWTWF